MLMLKCIMHLYSIFCITVIKLLTMVLKFIIRLAARLTSMLAAGSKSFSHLVIVNIQ